MDQWRAGRPIVVGGATLVPIEHSFLAYDAGDNAGWLHGLKEPWAIVVCDPGGVRAFDTEGRSIPVAPLLRKVPALGALLPPPSP